MDGLNAKKDVDFAKYKVFADSLKISDSEYLYYSFKADLDSLNKILGDSSQINFVRGELDKKFQDLKLSYLNHSKSWFAYVNKQNRLDLVYQSNIYIRNFSALLIIIGSGLMILGFFNWYYKYQIYLDAERKVNGEKFIKKLKKVKKKNQFNSVKSDS